jgi:hypothetical protein
MEELFYVAVLDNNDEVVYYAGDYPMGKAVELTNHLNGLLVGLGLAPNEDNANDYLAVFYLTKLA